VKFMGALILAQIGNPVARMSAVDVHICIER
jgi:hypothetical protein